MHNTIQQFNLPTMHPTYLDKTVHLICVLKGGSIFFSDLMRAMNKLHSNTGLDYIPYTMDFIRVSSYEGTESTGCVKVDLSYGDISALSGRHILFVEDIIDTGLTMVKLQEYFGTKTQCLSMETATLLEVGYTLVRRCICFFI